MVEHEVVIAKHISLIFVWLGVEKWKDKENEFE